MARTQELRHLPAEPRGAGGIEERDGAGAEAKREFKRVFFGGKLLRKRGAASPAAETERAETSAEREVVVLPEPRREEEEK